MMHSLPAHCQRSTIMLDRLARAISTGSESVMDSRISRRSVLKKTLGASAVAAAGATVLSDETLAQEFCRTGTSANYCPSFCSNGFLRCPNGTCGTADCNTIYSSSGTFINRGVTNCRSGPSRCYGVVTSAVGGCGDGISINGVYYFGDCVTNVCSGARSSIWYRTSRSGCWLSRAYSGFATSSCC